MSVEGVAELTNTLTKKVPAAVAAAMRQAIDAEATRMASQMKALAYPGRVANSIHTKEAKGGKYSLDDFGVLIIAGNGSTIVYNSRGEGFQLTRIIEFGILDGSQPARPFFFPVYRAYKTQARRRITTAVNKAIQQFSASDDAGAGSEAT